MFYVCCCCYRIDPNNACTIHVIFNSYFTIHYDGRKESITGVAQ
jgi:hypothetical protein